jgi:hypothetical protein
MQLQTIVHANMQELLMNIVANINNVLISKAL